MRVLMDLAKKRNGLLHYVASLSYHLMDKKLLTQEEMDKMIKDAKIEDVQQ